MNLFFRFISLEKLLSRDTLYSFVLTQINVKEKNQTCIYAWKKKSPDSAAWICRQSRKKWDLSLCFSLFRTAIRSFIPWIINKIRRDAYILVIVIISPSRYGIISAEKSIIQKIQHVLYIILLPFYFTLIFNVRVLISDQIVRYVVINFILGFFSYR